MTRAIRLAARVWRELSLGTVAIAVLGLTMWGWWGRVLADGPLAEITAPPPGFKLRQGRAVAVAIRVEQRQQPVRNWTVQLSGPNLPNSFLAQGVGPVSQPVAQVAADTLAAGETYRLTLSADDTAGGASSATTTFLIPDPRYTLIPLEPGNMIGTAIGALSLDASGNRISFGGEVKANSTVLLTLDTPTATLRQFDVQLVNTTGPKLTKDGQRLYFPGAFENVGYGIGMVDIASGAISGVVPGEPFFSVSQSGKRVAFQSVEDLDPSVGNPDRTLQYFLYDEESARTSQLTSDAHAIDRSTSCPHVDGTTPLISANGNVVVFVTSATLGIAPASETRCHVFSYDVATRVLRHVAALDPDVEVDVPVLSDDGRWLTYSSTRPVPSAGGRVGTFGARLDLQTGEVTDPIAGISAPTFDAVVTGDGLRVLLSTEADLDPRVGNSDNNMEMFLYNMATGGFTQVSETTGGIRPFSGNCFAFDPRVNQDGRVVAFPLAIFSVELCQLDGPQRNEADGLVLGRVRGVRKRSGNHPPAFTQIADARILAGKSITLTLAAADADGDPVVFFAQRVNARTLPTGAAIEDHRDGTATVQWATRLEDAGVHRLRVAAFDEGGGEVVRDVTLSVCNRIDEDTGDTAVARALFEPEPPPQCTRADRNGDGAVSAADTISPR